jgi:type VI secretion system protein ImpC
VAKPFDFGSVNLSAGENDANGRPISETPFRILILGDFSGRANRSICDVKSIAARRPVEIDRDNADEVISRLGVELKLALWKGGFIHLKFSELEDFHPDRLFEKVAGFETLREFHGKLGNPSTFSEAARELGLAVHEVSGVARQDGDPSPLRAPSAVQVVSGSLLDEMIEETESRASRGQAARAPDPVRDFARRVAEQDAQATPDSRQPQVLAVLDRAIGGLMRAILHNRDFQALEAIWRATSFLVRQLDTDSQLKVDLLDISKDELAADLSSVKNLRESGIYRVLVESTVETPGAEPWAAIVGAYRLDEGPENAGLLTGMARIAQRARAPFLAEASPHLLGCASLESATHVREWGDVANWWRELRHVPEAQYVGLAIPRFLLRLPYGKKTSPLESFDFEELGETPGHDDYLWGNPGFALALLLGQSFSEFGWQMSFGTRAQIDRLPLHFEVTTGEAQAKPCAEALLTEETVATMIEAGFMPLVSFKNRDSVRLARFQSIADPTRPLAGLWQT